MKLMVTCRVAAVGVLAVVGPAVRGSEPALSAPEGTVRPKRAEDKVTLTLDFRGLIALLPQGEGSEGYDKGKPMGAKGKVQKIVALLPRADAYSLSAEDLPSPLDFGHGGGSHPAHFAALRIDAKYLVTPGLGELILSLPSRRNPKTVSTYEVGLRVDGEETEKVTFVGGDELAPVIDGKPGKPDYAKPVSAGVCKDSRFVAMVTLDKGEQVSTEHAVYKETPKWVDAYHLCRVASNGVECTDNESTYFAHSALADRVLATRTTDKLEAMLWVKEYVDGASPSSVYEIPLKAADGAILVRVESGPAEELLVGGGAPEGHAFPHFKLFYLLSYKPSGWYYFPALKVERVDPFCTPLAQFVQPK